MRRTGCAPIHRVHAWKFEVADVTALRVFISSRFRLLIFPTVRCVLLLFGGVRVWGSGGRTLFRRQLNARKNVVYEYSYKLSFTSCFILSSLPLSGGPDFLSVFTPASLAQTVPFCRRAAFLCHAVKSLSHKAFPGSHLRQSSPFLHVSVFP